MISDGDLRRQMERHGYALLDRSAAECMTRTPVLVGRRELATRALDLLESRRITVAAGHGRAGPDRGRAAPARPLEDGDDLADDDTALVAVLVATVAGILAGIAWAAARRRDDGRRLSGFRSSPHYTRGPARARRGQLELAIHELEKVPATHPDSVEVQQVLSHLLREVGQGRARHRDPPRAARAARPDARRARPRASRAWAPTTARRASSTARPRRTPRR